MFGLYHRYADLNLLLCNRYMEKVNDKKIRKMIEKDSSDVILLGQANRID